MGAGGGALPREPQLGLRACQAARPPTPTQPTHCLDMLQERVTSPVLAGEKPGAKEGGEGKVEGV